MYNALSSLHRKTSCKREIELRSTCTNSLVLVTIVAVPALHFQHLLELLTRVHLLLSPWLQHHLNRGVCATVTMMVVLCVFDVARLLWETKKNLLVWQRSFVVRQLLLSMQVLEVAEQVSLHLLGSHCHLKEDPQQMSTCLTSLTC